MPESCDCNHWLEDRHFFDDADREDLLRCEYCALDVVDYYAFSFMKLKSGIMIRHTTSGCPYCGERYEFDELGRRSEGEFDVWSFGCHHCGLSWEDWYRHLFSYQNDPSGDYSQFPQVYVGRNS